MKMAHGAGPLARLPVFVPLGSRGVFDLENFFFFFFCVP